MRKQIWLRGQVTHQLDNCRNAVILNLVKLWFVNISTFPQHARATSIYLFPLLWIHFQGSLGLGIYFWELKIKVTLQKKKKKCPYFDHNCVILPTKTSCVCWLNLGDTSDIKGIVIDYLINLKSVNYYYYYYYYYFYQIKQSGDLNYD